jgi:molybdenum cofactor synthesis domain-containing protein
VNSNPTACIVVIGNEVLSGRTQDANIRFLAQRLGDMGIPVREVRIIPDVEDTIVRTINEVRAAYDHVFTTGGIGPTHDDITSECVAKAFGVPWEPQKVVWERMKAHYPPGQFNAARQRMATMPRGVVLIDNGRAIAPGFSMVNVHVMAGVPAIMRAMFEMLAPTLRGGKPIISRSLHCPAVREGDIAEGLTAIQERYPWLDIGSYPYFRDAGPGVAIVAKGTDPDAAGRAIAEVAELFKTRGLTAIDGEPT